MLTNPFTGEVLNANPEGHNQYTKGVNNPFLSSNLTREQMLALKRMNKLWGRNRGQELGRIAKTGNTQAVYEKLKELQRIRHYTGSETPSIDLSREAQRRARKSSKSFRDAENALKKLKSQS